MRVRIGWLGTAALLAVLSFSTTAPGSEEKIPLDKVPKAVIDTVKARFKDATITGSAIEETDDGKSVYEISLKTKDKTIDVILTPAGKIVLFEQSIAQGDLPKAVAKTLAEKYPQATFKRLEQVFKVVDGKEKLDFYEFLLVTGTKEELEVKLAEDGKVQSAKAADPE